MKPVDLDVELALDRQADALRAHARAFRSKQRARAAMRRIPDDVDVDARAMTAAAILSLCTCPKCGAESDVPVTVGTCLFCNPKGGA